MAPTREIIFEALDNAVQNGFDHVADDSYWIAGDLIHKCADCEDSEPEELIPHIDAWKEARKTPQT